MKCPKGKHTDSVNCAIIPVKRTWGESSLWPVNICTNVSLLPSCLLCRVWDDKLGLQWEVSLLYACSSAELNEHHKVRRYVRASYVFLFWDSFYKLTQNFCKLCHLKPNACHNLFFLTLVMYLLHSLANEAAQDPACQGLLTAVKFPFGSVGCCLSPCTTQMEDKFTNWR